MGLARLHPGRVDLNLPLVAASVVARSSVYNSGRMSLEGPSVKKLMLLAWQGLLASLLVTLPFHPHIINTKPH